MKRGQAAFEYLTTYGWVLLTAVVAVGALMYFGFLTPSKFLPDRCWFGPQMICEDYRIQKQGGDTLIQWKVRNNYGRAIRILDAGSRSQEFAVGNCSDMPKEVAIGNIKEISCELAGQTFVEGQKYGIPTVVKFERNASGDPPDHNVSGEIYTTVQ